VLVLIHAIAQLLERHGAIAAVLGFAGTALPLLPAGWMKLADVALALTAVLIVFVTRRPHDVDPPPNHRRSEAKKRPARPTTRRGG